MKRLLLDENFPVESCEDTLLKVLSDIRKIHKGEHDTDTVSSLMKRVGRIMNLPQVRTVSAAETGGGAFALWK